METQKKILYFKFTILFRKSFDFFFNGLFCKPLTYFTKFLFSKIYIKFFVIKFLKNFIINLKLIKLNAYMQLCNKVTCLSGYVLHISVQIDNNCFVLTDFTIFSSLTEAQILQINAVKRKTLDYTGIYFHLFSLKHLL